MIAIENIDWNDRFWSKIDRRAPHDCSLWMASRLSNGYGQYRMERTQKLAHRLSFELCNGPIPVDKPYICHFCNNRLCCNPTHLYAGTQKDNLQQMSREGRHGSITHPERVPR